MRNNNIQFALLSVGLMLMLACGSGVDQQPAQGSSTAGDAPGAATASGGAPAASTPGADMRGEGPASAPAKEPVITTMPMDVPSGTDLVLTLETPVSSETAKVDQPVRAKVAEPVVVAGMEVIPKDALVTGAVVSAERSGRVKGLASVALALQ